MNSVHILQRLEALQITPSGKPLPSVPRSAAGFERRAPLDLSSVLASIGMPDARGIFPGASGPAPDMGVSR